MAVVVVAIYATFETICVKLETGLGSQIQSEINNEKIDHESLAELLVDDFNEVTCHLQGPSAAELSVYSISMHYVSEDPFQSWLASFLKSSLSR